MAHTPGSGQPKQLLRKAAWICVVLGFLMGMFELATPAADAQAVATISTVDYVFEDVNAEFDVVITLTAGNEPVAASQYLLRYDPTLIQPVLLGPAGGGIEGSPECFGIGVAVAVCGPLNPTNELQLSTFRVTGAWAANPDGSPRAFDVMTIPFTAQGATGVSPLEIEVTQMLSPGPTPIPFAANGGSVTIAPPGPSPTVTLVPPTQTPVPPTPTLTPVPPTPAPTAPTATPVPTTATATPVRPAAIVTATPVRPAAIVTATATAATPTATAATPTATGATVVAPTSIAATAVPTPAPGDSALGAAALPYPGPVTNAPSSGSGSSFAIPPSAVLPDPTLSASAGSSTDEPNAPPLAVTGTDTPLLATLSFSLLAVGGLLMLLARRENKAVR